MQSFLWKAFLYAAVKVFTIFKKQNRFYYAFRISKIAAPLLRRFSILNMPPFCLGSYFEFTLATVLNSLTYHNVEFDPVMTVTGAEELNDDGAIFIGGHFYLNFLFLRWLHNQKYEPSAVLRLGSVKWKIAGTNVPLDIIKADVYSLLHIRRKIKDGRFINIAIDHHEPAEKWQKIECEQREIFVQDTIIKFAKLTNVPIFFSGVRAAADGNIMINIVRPKSNDASGILKEFGAFLNSSL